MKKGLSIILSLALIMGNAMTFKALSQDGSSSKEQGKNNSSQIESIGNEISYNEFLNKYENVASPSDVVNIDINGFKSDTDSTKLVEDYEARKGTSLYTHEGGYIEFEVDVEKEGLYSLAIDFLSENSRGAKIERKVMINGEVQHKEANLISFNRLYIDDPNGLGKKDANGNDIRPSQIEVKKWQSGYFRDSQGYYPNPLQFYFKSGKNTIKIESISEPLTIGKLELRNTEKTAEYADVLKQYEQNGYKDAESNVILIEGENATLKSDPVLYPLADQTGPTTNRFGDDKMHLATIGGYRWQNLKQFMTWDFEVEESGLYTIYIKARQNITKGVKSNRAIYIDGKIPFAEFENYEIDFYKKWQLLQLGNKDQEFKIYLEKGKHELKMEVVLGEMAQQINKVQDILFELNEIYTAIMIITGSEPDNMRDYRLGELIPAEIKRLGELADQLEEVATWFEEYTGSNGQNTASLKTAVIQTKKMVSDPDKIPKNLGFFKTNIGSVATWLTTVTAQPLEIDYIAFGSTEKVNLPKVNANFFEQIWYNFKRFIKSFVDGDVGVAAAEGQTEVKETIKVWLPSGRDQAQVLRKLIDSDFVPKYGIGVDLELVNPGALLPATVAGTGPDVALNMGDAEPLNYAIRNAIIDLTQFEDYNEIAKRFLPERLVPLNFDGKAYALPETQTFNVMFYRKDILKKLDISVPKTWQDVISIIPILQKNNMSFAMPVSTTNIPQGGVQSYLTLLYQNGGSLYNDNGKTCGLDSAIGVSAFKQWTNLYENYGLPMEYDFLTRFRTGEYPLIVGDFSNFNSLTVSAPEIRGLWSFTLIPGTVKQDGSIDRSMPIGGLNSFIMKNSTKYDASWEFMKWWTDAETQVQYGKEMESILGASARYSTANLEAFNKIPWSSDLFSVLNEQMKYGKGVEQVPGGYFVGRHLDNAFRKVIISKDDAKESIYDYVYVINEELTAKRNEFGIE